MFNHTIVYGVAEWGLIECDSIIKESWSDDSIGVIMQPEINCRIVPLKHLFTTQVMSQHLRLFPCSTVGETRQGTALKLPPLSHSSHFRKLQASECWNKLCRGISIFIISLFFWGGGGLVNMVYEAKISSGHTRAGHESCLYFTNKLSLLQTGGKAAPHFFPFYFQ